MAGIFDQLLQFLTPEKRQTFSYDAASSGANDTLRQLLGGPANQQADSTGRAVNQAAMPQPGPIGSFDITGQPTQQQPQLQGRAVQMPGTVDSLGPQMPAMPPPDPSQFMTLPAPPPTVQPAQQQNKDYQFAQPPRGVMDQFIQQLPELALSAFSNIGKNPIRYRGTGGFIGLGALRGLQGAAVPLAHGLAAERAGAQKSEDAMQAADAYGRAMGQTPQQLAQSRAAADLALKAPVGEMATLQQMQIRGDQQQQYKDIVASALPELKSADPLLRKLAVAEAQQGKFGPLTDLIAADRLPPDLRMKIAQGLPLTNDDFRALSGVPGSQVEKLMEVHAKAQDRDAARDPKVGTTKDVWVDGPNGGLVYKLEYGGRDAQGNPVWNKQGDAVPRFKPGANVDDQINQLKIDATRSQVLQRTFNQLERQQRDLDEISLMPQGKKSTPEEVLKYQTDMARKKEALRQRWEDYYQQSDSLMQQGPVSEDKARQGKSPPAPPPAKVFETPPPAAQYKGKILRNPQTGQRLQSDGKNWIPVQ